VPSTAPPALFPVFDIDDLPQTRPIERFRTRRTTKKRR
jgi:hypothetical protein